MTAQLSAILVGLVIIGLGLTEVTLRRIYIVAWLAIAVFIGAGLIAMFTNEPTYTVRY